MTQPSIVQSAVHPAKIDVWTGIRALAALWVVLFHLSCYSLKLDFGWFQAFIGRGELGVDLFFILSGLVISYVHQAEFPSWNTDRACRFWVLRFARIYPLHLLMLLGMALQEQFENLYSWAVANHGPCHRPNSLQDFCLSLFNIHDWETTGTLSFNYPSWSVSAEWFAYLLFPLMTPFVARIRGCWQNLLIIALSLGGLYLTACLSHAPNLGFTYHLGLIRVTTEFLTGCALFNLFREQREQQRTISFCEPLTWLFLLLIPILIQLHTHDIWAVAAMAGLLYLLPQAKGLIHQIFANRFMVFGGEISYAVYMVHAFVLHIINDSFVFYFRHQHWTMLETAGVALLSLTLTILAAIPLNRYIEVPARNAIRRFWEERATRLSQPVPSQI